MSCQKQSQGAAGWQPFPTTLPTGPVSQAWDLNLGRNPTTQAGQTVPETPLRVHCLLPASRSALAVGVRWEAAAILPGYLLGSTHATH